ncbi:MAG: nucleoside deaminase [Eubacteriaceae bacterium]|nr:nucleoside deaminase [Eubacteriaceae bacterium]
MYDHMREALRKAAEAGSAGEIPVGAVIVKNGEVVCGAANECEQRLDPTAHAEMLAIREACRILGTKTLQGCELYVTLEPCPMCAGAAAAAGISKLVFGSYDTEYGACGSVWNLPAHPFSGRMEVYGGIMEADCASMLREFFSGMRQKKKAEDPPISIS